MCVYRRRCYLSLVRSALKSLLVPLSLFFSLSFSLAIQTNSVVASLPGSTATAVFHLLFTVCYCDPLSHTNSQTGTRMLLALQGIYFELPSLLTFHAAAVMSLSLSDKSGNDNMREVILFFVSLNSYVFMRLCILRIQQIILLHVTIIAHNAMYKNCEAFFFLTVGEFAA